MIEIVSFLKGQNYDFTNINDISDIYMKKGDTINFTKKFLYPM